MTPLQPGRKGPSALRVAARALARVLAWLEQALESLGKAVRPAVKRIGRPLQIIARYMPKGLYPRALVIVIAPVVLLQSVIAYVFMERHWQTVTQRLSSAVSADIAMLIDVYESYPQDADTATLSRIAAERLGMDLDIIPDSDLPAPGPRPFFSLLDNALSTELSQQVARPFWLDTVGRSSLIEIRIKLGKNVMRILTRRNSAYASNSHIFLLWMIGTSLILLTIAVLFLRNQIRPILKLADAAEAFGKGRDADFRPRGAREVRRAGNAFIEMKRRVERSIGERTTMLNGVSHDLRTILTRFRLSLALMERSSEIEALEKDVDEMSRMLEDYLAFARGDAGETAVETDIRSLLEELKSDAERQGHQTELTVIGDPLVVIRPDAFRRLLTNLVSNAARYGDRIAIRATHDARYLIVMVDDDGPGIPPDQREDVFRPFFRLDEARNVDGGGTGLGLAIARDIARAHGGDIMLTDSPLGGLRATVRLPV
ncbi:two-component system osmolarity sensor histidine kinase EnvZ [Bosea sp. BE271]|nr:two-component system osmolarity sensor histidine kinase EnvZ [Bosea robiniae]MDR6896595.1 two-component system osmolarity sensor histidine kinase EnvZ [Bosea sp. BE109]MDR7139993.1 two-component system osmolarity sensor histidine kinase EnvZ [Bosea sp. BE168]MDR7176693.1 two-component system osmolarity sensor histidine kinase EnvZ [Bosea sp. BE271]